MAETVQKKRCNVPKNRKKAWRKYSNIDDVEDFLEDQRIEERLGGCFADRQDENLFVIDSSGATKQCKKQRKPKEFKCFQFLKPLTNVKDPLIKRNRVRAPEERAHPVAKRKLEEKLLKKNGLAVKTAKVTASSLEAGSHLKKTANFNFDLWEHNNNKELKNAEDLQEDVVEHTLLNTRKKMIKVPEHRHVKPSALPGVEVPHPGTSYNPSFYDHQKLLRKGDRIEREKLKNEEHWERVTTDTFPTVSNAPTQETWIKEMSEGLSSRDEIVVKEEKEEGDEETSVMLPPKVTVRKTKRQRKQENKCRSKKKMKMLKKAKQQKLQDVSRIKSFKKEIRLMDEKLLMRKMRREAKEEAMKLKPHRLCKHKYQAPELELNLSEEVTGNLRTMKQEGNLFLDRYKSFQRKNIIEPRIKVKYRRRYKLKKYLKRGHKMDWERKPLDAVLDYVT